MSRACFVPCRAPPCASTSGRSTISCQSVLLTQPSKRHPSTCRVSVTAVCALRHGRGRRRRSTASEEQVYVASAPASEDLRCSLPSKATVATEVEVKRGDHELQRSDVSSAACSGVHLPHLLGAVILSSVALSLACEPAVAEGLSKTGAIAASTFDDVLSQAVSKAFKGGVAGFAAGVAQVTLFMWLRTAMNVQYYSGGDLRTTLGKLWAEGGIRRLYQGYSIAVIEAPLVRFGDTAANGGVLLLLSSQAPWLPLGVQTALSSAAGASLRLLLTPLDTLKTTRQVQGPRASDLLLARVREGGVPQLFNGALANFAAGWVGSYPWFLTYNTLSAALPPAAGLEGLVRSAAIGFAASAVSDTTSNSLRVLKVVRQTSPEADLSYLGAAKRVIETDGWAGLFGRGLRTRLLTNALQGAFFSVAWKFFEEQLSRGGPVS